MKTTLMKLTVTLFVAMIAVSNAEEMEVEIEEPKQQRRIHTPKNKKDTPWNDGKPSRYYMWTCKVNVRGGEKVHSLGLEMELTLEDKKTGSHFVVPLKGRTPYSPDGTEVTAITEEKIWWQECEFVSVRVVLSLAQNKAYAAFVNESFIEPVELTSEDGRTIKARIRKVVEGKVHIGPTNGGSFWVEADRFDDDTQSYIDELSGGIFLAGAEEDYEPRHAR